MEDEKEFEFSDIQMEFQSQDEATFENTQEMTCESDEETQMELQSQNSVDLPQEHETDSQFETSEAEDTCSETNTEMESDTNFEENFEHYDFDDLPEHACSYCGIHSNDSVVKCNDCNRWFCNSRGKTTGAHIINHLVRAKHKRVSLHKDTMLGPTVLECFNCGGKNVFLLGFIPAKADSIVVLLCREPCLSLNSLKEMNWDLTQWVPLIKDRSLLSWLVREPSEKEENRAIEISSIQIRQLEEMWKNGQETATVRDLQELPLLNQVDAVRVRYEDAEVFNRIYRALIALEADEEKKSLEDQSQRLVEVRWEGGVNKNLMFFFRLNRNVESNVRVTAGDEVIITYPGDSVNRRWAGRGTVLETTLTDEVVVELIRNAASAPTTQTLGFNVDFVWKPVPYDRMKDALRTFAEDDFSVTSYLYHVLLGHEVEPHRIKLDLPDDLSAPGLPKLNSSQNVAVRHSLEQPISLIQGPPGTGKTVTSASLVYHLAKQGKGQVLVCAPSNIGVDQLTAKIHSTGLKVVRLASKSREAVHSFVDFLYINVLVKRLSKESGGRLHKLQTRKEEQGMLSRSEEKELGRMNIGCEIELLERADVICTTCVGAGDRRLRKFRFKQVVVDESTQATEPEVFIPLVSGAKQVVLIGDHCQLGPTVMNKKAESAGLQRSLFERLIMLGVKPMRLQVQYRMHPCLSEFASETFYEGTLQNGVSSEERRHKAHISFEWPDSDRPMFFYSSLGQEEFSASGTSYLNRVEAINVEKVVTKMLRCGITPEQIGIVTPYEGQRQYIVSTMMRTGAMQKNWYEELEVASVDAFQGREKDYIILSCVRSNKNQGIGFLNDPRRLNVALTRARYGLVVIGNPKVLSTQGLWHKLISHFKRNHLLVEGLLDDLTECFIRLSPPQRYFERHRIFGEKDEMNENCDYVRQNNGESAVPETLPTQYAYVHPGEIGVGSFGGGELLNSKRNLKPKINDFSQSKTDYNPESFDEMSLETEETFGMSLDEGFLPTLEEETEMSQSGRTQLAPSNDEFTQHMQSQLSSMQTLPEESQDSFNDMSFGGLSQEPELLSQELHQVDEE